jgi:hypothetical protein
LTSSPPSGRGFQLLRRQEQQLRFAVHRPGSPVVSPRSHRMPCGDVPGRVHIRVAGEGAGDAGEESLALAALRCDVPVRRATLASERGTDLLHPAGCLVLQSPRQLAALLQVVRRGLPAWEPVRVLLDGEVPNVPGVRAVAAQHCLLGGRREQPVPGHANTLATTTDIFGEVRRRSLPGPEAGVWSPRF